MNQADFDGLRARLRDERLNHYVRLRGGYSVPLAGMIYWLGLGVLGYRLELADWAMAAFLSSGAIFPLALILSRMLNNPFMKEKSAVDSVLLPAFAAMLLFWCFIVAAGQEAPSLVPLILAVGMSLHWPVIGWSYGRTGIYTAHAVLRSLAATWIWLTFPEHRLTWLPFSVAFAYAATVVVIWIDSGVLARRMNALRAR